VRSDQIELFINGGGTSTPVSISAGAWHHIAVSRQAGTVNVYMDGTRVGSYANGGSIPARACLVGVSAHSGGEYVNGYIDDLRLTVGVARYTGSTLTLPTAAFPNTSVTVTPQVGEYTIDTGVYTGEVQIVCLDDDAGTLYNDQIARVFPV
jgi:hypothetical protein